MRPTRGIQQSLFGHCVGYRDLLGYASVVKIIVAIISEELIIGSPFLSDLPFTAFTKKLTEWPHNII